MSEIIDILENKLLQDEPGLLEVLLIDHTTRNNIFWATDCYAYYGQGYEWHDSITVETITGKHGNVIMPRALKSRDEQLRRSRQMAEVFTPAWIVRKMTDVMDKEWTAFYEEKKKDAWQGYVLATVLEITCGEAPFLSSRYDTVSGELIPMAERFGALDRKLRKVNDNCSDDEWTRWALLALGSVYGYEWQGDNLLLAREALLATFNEYHEQRFGTRADSSTLLKAAEIVSWNVWQMDGLKAVVPCSCHDNRQVVSDFFVGQTTTVTPCLGCDKNDILLHNGLRCRLRRWLLSSCDMPDHFDCLYLDFITKNYKTHNKTKWPMKFDFVIGNPPYQEEKEDNGRQPPIYDKFMDGTYQVSGKVLLISPARFLFNAGQTPKEWIKKMLSDPHLKVLMYEQDSSKVFQNTDIKGGVAVTYRDANTKFGEIGSFTTFSELNSITKKVENNKSFSKGAFAKLISSRGIYRFTNDIFEENPQMLKGRSKGTGNMITSNSFDLFPDIFTIDKPESKEEYIQIFGRVRNQRVYRWIKKRYVIINDFLEKYNVFVPEANGTGAIGEVLSTPLIGVTDTFISIGKFDKEIYAKACLKYVKTKFARTMLGVLKATQHNPKQTWKYVPLQDFTSSSDIDWTKSVHEIDLQLYNKYGLTAEERNFIETHVKEMV